MRNARVELVRDCRVRVVAPARPHQSYARLLQFPARTRRPAHLLFYEDLKRHPDEVRVRAAPAAFICSNLE